MFCTQCGTHLAAEARYCTSCGKATAMESQPLQAVPLSPGAAPVYCAAEAAPRRLRRIIAKKKIAGVCAGFAEYFGMDITLMRLIWVGLLIMPPNVGIIGYIVAWAVLPKE